MVRNARTVAILAVIALSAACGARSEKHGSGGDEGSDAGDAGDRGDAGAGVGGTSSGGTSGGGGAAGLSGGGGITDYSTLPPCLQPIDGGLCNAAFPRFGFDPVELRCVEFTYGGCNANDNNFETLEACEAECGEAFPDCDQASRPLGCPCTSETVCSGACSNAFYELSDPPNPQVTTCPPSIIGLCTIGTEGGCVCPLAGGEGYCGF